MRERMTHIGSDNAPAPRASAFHDQAAADSPPACTQLRREKRTRNQTCVANHKASKVSESQAHR